jgi:hypothetical protein
MEALSRSVSSQPSCWRPHAGLMAMAALLVLHCSTRAWHTAAWWPVVQLWVQRGCGEEGRGQAFESLGARQPCRAALVCGFSKACAAGGMDRSARRQALLAFQQCRVEKGQGSQAMLARARPQYCM